MQVVKLRRNRPEPTPLRTLDEPVDRITDRPRIRIQQEDERRPRDPQSFVARTAVAEILTKVDNAHAGEVAPHEIGRAVSRRVVDDHNVVAAIDDERERALEISPRVVRDNDDRDVAQRPRILMILPYAPRLDARHGGKSVARLIAQLATTHAIGVIHLRRRSEKSACERIRDACVFVHEVAVAEPGSFRRRLARLAGLARGRPMQVTDFASRKLAAELANVERRWRPDVVHAELEAMAHYLHHVVRPRVLVVVEPAAQTADEVWRQSVGLERIVRLLDRRAWRRYERIVAGIADAVVTLTDRDAAYARPLGREVHTIGLGTEIPSHPLDPLGADPPGILFVGGFGHAPNVAAAVALVARILPLVHGQRPETKLYLVGDRPPPAVQALASTRVVVTGGVQDVTRYLNDAAVVVAPIGSGGGMRLKVLETLAAGKPIVATPLALAGLDVRHREHVLIAEDDASFANAIVELLDDPVERRRLAEAARGWAIHHLDPAVEAAAYGRLYDGLGAGAAQRG